MHTTTCTTLMQDLHDQDTLCIRNSIHVIESFVNVCTMVVCISIIHNYVAKYIGNEMEDLTEGAHTDHEPLIPQKPEQNDGQFGCRG